MAFRSASYLKSAVNHFKGSSSLNYATAATSKLKPFSPLQLKEAVPKSRKGDFVPVCVALGMIGLSTSFGVHTAMQQLRRSPNVHVKKSRRETLPEIVEPEHVAQETDKFINKSLFRKSLWQSVATRVTANSAFAKSNGTKWRSYASTAEHPDAKPRGFMKGDFVPVYVALGLIALSMGFGLQTAMHQLKRAPNVSVKKSRRETVPEVTEPEEVVDDSEKFLKKSFFRKVAHVQDFDDQSVISDPIRGDVLAREPHTETLQSVGVNPNA
ncbi:hypothetical protein CQW23_31109 [Capsicum baccatum]|uniref:Uncharacterized protein n=1 Tax=Capsicum baccatum TaxID=33114 RepID=A0A2G2V8K9_CAPBA|nr:hypothetical protein CQW23_31109 [Capsicum baccatum]